jgi:hypothetical protein
MKRPLLLTAAGVAALVLAIAFALLGRAVLAAPDRVEAARAGGTQEERSPFDRAADWLLGVGDPDPFFELVRTYRRAVADTSITIDSSTPVRLGTLARRVGPRTEQAQAHVMVGTVFALPAGNGSMSFTRLKQIGGGRLLNQATQEFRAAALLDERNEAAKYDLELALTAQNPAFSALSGRRQTPTQRPPGRNRHQGQDAKHPRTKKRLKQGGVYGSGSGY